MTTIIVLANDEEQHSLWKTFADAPAGLRMVNGAADRAAWQPAGLVTSNCVGWGSRVELNDRGFPLTIAAAQTGTAACPSHRGGRPRGRPKRSPRNSPSPPP